MQNKNQMNEGGSKMKNKNQKAVGFVTEIKVAGSVISKEDQRARIAKYAAKEGIELVAVYEDSPEKVFGSTENYDTVLVERVWAFGKKMSEVGPAAEKIEAKGAKLVATSYMWDCVSQQVRQRYMENGFEAKHQAAVAAACETKSVVRAA
jgi:hypothetical protein